ncbi:unnamed protein product [Somion occarium]
MNPIPVNIRHMLHGEGSPQSILHALDAGSLAVPAPIGEVVNYDPKAEDGTKEEEIAKGDTGSVLEVKHIDEVYDMFTGQWSVKSTPPSAVQSSTKEGGKYDAYAFTVIRKFQPTTMSRDNKATSYNVTKQLEIHSDHLKSIGQDVIGHVQGISWTAKPLRVDPQAVLGWLQELQAYASKLSAEAIGAPEDSPVHLKMEHLNHFLNYLTNSYESTLTTLSSLTIHGEITFDLLWALFVPNKTILYLLCPTTNEPRAVRLVHAEKCQKPDQHGGMSAAYDPSGLTVGGDGGNEFSKLMWRLVVEYVEVDVGTRKEPGVGTVGFGYAGLGSVIDIAGFAGAKKISSLGVFPFEYYAGPGGPEGLKKRLIERGKRWTSMAGGVHHLAYQGIAYQWKRNAMGSGSYIKCNVNSRVMIDRKTFSETVPNYEKFPIVTKTLSNVDIDRHVLRLSTGTSQQEEIVEAKDLTDEQLMLTTPILYGFSLSDKIWLEFTSDFVQPFEWNNEAYANLVIPAEQKLLLTTLVEVHNSSPAAKFDDFVEGKGLGLVINLFGNPGTGKSLTAEAMSEYLKKPLYVVGAGDLGTSADRVDSALSVILKISATWGAVVLIDEADVFLEERSLQFLERNAMVAVFLRHLEYFRGILFLTTNRVRVFDEAFQSRIHVSLRYQDLKPDARRQIWVAFLQKANGNIPNGGLNAEELRHLGEKKINGRQIKNVVRTAGALAYGKNERLGYSHLVQVLDMMDQFDASQSMYQ